MSNVVVFENMAAQQQVREREEHGRNLPEEGAPDRTKSLLRRRSLASVPFRPRSRT